MTKAVRQELTENDRRLRRALIAFFARRVQTLSEAEDLTQDVFFRIVRDPKREAPMADAYV
ncbi:sigma factor, partial [Klebsiella aerogenes]